MVQEFKEAEEANLQLQRPLQSHGTQGTRTRVTTNHVMINQLPEKDIQVYTVITEGLKPRERKEKLDALYKHLINGLGLKVFCSGNMIASFESNLEKVYQVPNGKTFDKEQQLEVDYLVPLEVKFRVTRNLRDLHKYVKDVSSKLTPGDVQELLQICDIMCKFDPTFRRLVMGSGQFAPESREFYVDLHDSHLRLLKGMQCHTKLSDNKGIVLNIDAKYHLLYQELNVYDAFKASGHDFPKTLAKEFKGVKVCLLSNTTKRKLANIVGVSDLNAETYMFPASEGKEEISVADYFAERGIQLKHPKAPLVCTNKKRNTFYPPELLKIAPNQSYDKPVPDINMIRRDTCLKPHDRINHIERLIHKPEFQIDPSSGIVADSALLKIPARFLQCPSVLFKNREVRKPSNQNVIDTKNAKFDQGCEINSYAIVNFSRVRYDVIDNNLIRNLKMTARNHATVFPNAKAPYLECEVDPRGHYSQHEEVENILKEAYTEASIAFGKKPDIIICITPSLGCGVYNHVKRLTETTNFFPNELVLTQFCCADKFKENRGRVTVNAQYASNIWLKLNEKLSYANGSNTVAWRLGSADLGKFIHSPTMVLGVDVCHGNEGNQRDGDQSIATFVGSVNSRFSDYRNASRPVEGENTGEVVKDALKELFELFKETSKCYPKQLVVFRDGLSEGQFEKFGTREIEGMRQAAKELGFEFKLVFISCIKRHQVRFFSSDQNNCVRNGNIKNGLVVDSDITGKYFEFFLQSHNGLQGTAIPTRYVVLHDDMKLTGDDVQQFCLNMCYNFQRSATPTSIPNVVKMADLFAGRLKRCNLYTNLDEKTETLTGEPVRLNSKLLRRAFYC